MNELFIKIVKMDLCSELSNISIDLKIDWMKIYYIKITEYKINWMKCLNPKQKD